MANTTDVPTTQGDIVEAQEGTEPWRQMKRQCLGAATVKRGIGVTADEEGHMTTKSLIHQGHVQKSKYARTRQNSRFQPQVTGVQAWVDTSTTILQDGNSFHNKSRSKNMRL